MKMKKSIVVFLAVFLLFSCFTNLGFAQNTVTAKGIVEISKYGNVKINLPHNVLDADFELGDIVTVSFGAVSVDVPLCVAFADVDSGSAGLFRQFAEDGTEETELAVNMGNFAEAYGIAQKTVFPDKTYVWEYQNGFSENTVFTLTMKEKAGYLKEFTVRNLVSTNERGDYSELTDERFANFREVSAGNIAKGKLYRSSSPLDPSQNRNTYADQAIKNSGVTHIINLNDPESALDSYKGYENSCYQTTMHFSAAASMNFTAIENKAIYAECFRYILDHPNGVFCVHCREGKERTGYFVAIIECLMGADYQEICEDYMLTYENFFGIKKDDEAYKVIKEGVFRKTLSEIFKADPETADLSNEAEEYLTELGLSKQEIAGLKQIFSAKNTNDTVFKGFFALIKDLFTAFIDLLLKLFTGVC